MDDLNSVPLVDLKANSISRSHLIHMLPGNRKAMILLRAGDYIEQSFITKYLEKGMVNIYELPIVDPDELAAYRGFLARLKVCKTEREKFMVRDEIIKHLAIDFYKNEKSSFLNFVVACFDEFYIYPNLTMDRFQNVSMVLYSRALLTSTVSVIATLTNNFVDYDYLKDFYNTCFIMDYGLVEYELFNYTISMACESERKEPGTGLNLLKRMRRSEGEIGLFKNHPEVSFEYAQTHSQMFKNPEVINMVKFHHEKVDGSGFPKGIAYSALSDAETLLSFCDYMIPFSEHEFALGDGHTIMFDYFEHLKTFDGQPLLPILKVINNWDAIMKWAIEQALKKQEQDKDNEMPVVDENAFGEIA